MEALFQKRKRKKKMKERKQKDRKTSKKKKTNKNETKQQKTTQRLQLNLVLGTVLGSEDTSVESWILSHG